MEINFKEEITCKQQNSFLSNKYTSQAIIQNVTNTKSEHWKIVRLTSFQERPSVNIAWGCAKWKKSKILKLCQNIGLGKLFLENEIFASK